MTDIETFRHKVELVSGLVRVDRRCVVRPPAHLVWLFEALTGRTGTTPPGYVLPRCAISNTPPDRLARTYCLLEELQAWTTRVDSGMQRHQQEMERQAAPKLARLRMAKEFAEKNVASEEPAF